MSCKSAVNDSGCLSRLPYSYGAQLAAAEMDHHPPTGVEHSALGGSERSALAASGPFPD